MRRTILHAFDVLIPAGTPKAAPLVTITSFEDNEVDRIDWLFPAGCAGLVGIQIGARAVSVIPRGTTQFLIRSGDSAGIDVLGAHTTGDWSVIGYNTGSFDHTVHVTYHTHRVEPETHLDLLIPESFALSWVGEG